MKKLLAIDNASKNIGFAFFIDGKLNDFWDLNLKGKTSAERLTPYYNKVKEFLVDWSPDEVAIETPGGKGWSIRVLSEFLGVLKLACYRRSLPVFLYAPTAIKKAMTGSGKASKQEVKESVKIYYAQEMRRMDYPELSEDVADAIALGYTHLKKMEEGSPEMV